MRSKPDNTKPAKCVCDILMPFALHILLKKFLGHCLKQYTSKILDLKFALQRIVMSYRFTDSI